MSDKNFKVKNGIDSTGPVTITTPNTSTTGLVINVPVGGKAVEFLRNGSYVGAIDDWGGLNTTQGINAAGFWYTRSPGIEAQSFFWAGSSTRSAAGFGGTTTGTNPVIYISSHGTGTNDLTQWLKPDNTIVAKVDYLGNITANDLTLSGNLTVNGTTTNLNSTNLIIEDKNIIIADVATPTDTTADGAGITIKGATDKTFSWVQSSGRFVSSEPVQSSAFIGTSNIYTPQLGSTVIGSATLNTNADTGGILINTAGASNKGFIVKGATSQTANLQEWQNSAGTVLTKIGSNGQVFINPSSASVTALTVKSSPTYPANLQEWQDSSGTILAQFRYSGSLDLYTISPFGNSGTYMDFTSSSINMNSRSTTTTSFVVKGAASQTADLQQWQNSTGTVLANIKSDGAFKTGLLQTGQFYTLTDTGPYLLSDQYGWSLINRNTVGTNIFTIKGMSGQTGNLQQWQNSAGTVLANVDANGKIAAPIFQSTVAGTAYIVTGSNNNAIRVQTNGTTNVGLIIRGETSQTANLQEWQNIDGTVLSKIDANGLISLPGGSWHLLGGFETWYKNSTSFYQKGASHVFRRQSDDTDLFTIGGNGNTSVLLQSASAVGLIVKSAASQTADLQQWQNSSGTVVARVESSGALNVSPVAAPNGYSIYVIGSGSSGIVTMKSTATSAHAIQLQNSANTIVFKMDQEGRIVPAATTSVGLTVRGITSQTANLQEWQNSSGTVLTNVRYDGSILITKNGDPATGVAAPFMSSPVNSGYSSAAVYSFWYQSGTGISNPYIHTLGINTNAIERMRFTSDGLVLINSSSSTLGGGSVASQLGVVIAAATTVGAVIRGQASQTANLQEWQNSAGTVLTRIASDGSIYRGSTTIDSYGAIYTTETMAIGANAGQRFASGGMTIINRESASAVIFGVKGISSQTGDLTQWRNSSDNILAKIDANGNFSAITKSFDIPHPTKENMRLRYASLEGPENGVYIRGTTKSNIIELPDYWTGLVHEDSITVSLTAVGSAQNIYVEKIENNKVYIGGELTKAFFTVYGERKDIDNLVVEY